MADEERVATPEEDAEILALVYRSRHRELAHEDRREVFFDLDRRGLVPRWRELNRTVPDPAREELEALRAAWLSSEEWLEVRTHLTKISGDEEVADHLARVLVATGTEWVRLGRGPLDTERLARVLWARRRIGNLHDVLAWAQLQEQLEEDGVQGP